MKMILLFAALLQTFIFTLLAPDVTLLAPGVTLLAPGAQDGAAPADPGAGIEWKKPEGATVFAEASAAYQEKKYKDALKLFKKALALVEKAESKETVDRWVRAATGGAELEQLRAQTKGGEKQADALAFATKSLPQYEGTAIYDEYKKFVEELNKEVYYVLENFDRPSGRYSEKQGKKFVDDPAKVKQGSHCLEWKIVSDPAEMRVEQIPKDLSNYQAVTFWLECPEKGAQELEVIFMAKGKTAMVGGQKTDNGFSKRVKCQRGWKKVELPLKEFQAFGEVSWDNVSDFRLRFTGPTGFTVYLDEIVLIRK